MKLIINLLLLISLTGYAQNRDSIQNPKVKSSITDKFPTTRVFDVQYEQLGATNYNAKFFGNAVEKGKITSHLRFKIAANIPLYKSKSKRFIITNSLRYKYEAFEFGNNYNMPSNTAFTRPKEEFHYLAEAISTTYFSSLFKKPILYNATVTIDGNDKAVQRVKGFVSAAMILKRTAATTMTIGAVLFIDPSSILPFAPVFTYEHQFSDSPWKLDIILPQSILVKRKLLENGRISFGTELNSENFYINFNEQNLRGVHELNQLEIKTGLMYEYSFFKNFIGTFKGGLNTIITSRITERGEKTSKYVIKNKQDPQVYFNLGFSYNPF